MKSDCVFCDILALQSPAEDLRRHGWNVYSFVPLDPVTPGHRLFVPTSHSPYADHSPVLTGQVFADASAWGGLKSEDFNLIVNNGKHASQTIFHLHVHYVPRREGDGLKLPWTEQKKMSVSRDEIEYDRPYLNAINSLWYQGLQRED